MDTTRWARFVLVFQCPLSAMSEERHPTQRAQRRTRPHSTSPLSSCRAPGSKSGASPSRFPELSQNFDVCNSTIIRISIIDNHRDAQFAKRCYLQGKATSRLGWSRSPLQHNHHPSTAQSALTLLPTPSPSTPATTPSAPLALQSGSPFPSAIPAQTAAGSCSTSMLLSSSPKAIVWFS